MWCMFRTTEGPESPHVGGRPGGGHAPRPAVMGGVLPSVQSSSRGNKIITYLHRGHTRGRSARRLWVVIVLGKGINILLSIEHTTTSSLLKLIYSPHLCSVAYLWVSSHSVRLATRFMATHLALETCPDQTTSPYLRHDRRSHAQQSVPIHPFKPLVLADLGRREPRFFVRDDARQQVLGDGLDVPRLPSPLQRFAQVSGKN